MRGQRSAATARRWCNRGPVECDSRRARPIAWLSFAAIIASQLSIRAAERAEKIAPGSALKARDLVVEAPRDPFLEARREAALVKLGPVDQWGEEDRARLGGAAGRGTVQGGALVCDFSLGPIECGSPLAGRLSAEDPIFAGGEHFDAYSLDLDAPTRVRVAMTSVPIDTFLFLADAGCAVLDSNDDCTPRDFDLSCVEVVLPAGRYYVVATSFSGGEVGDYELSVTCSEPVCASCPIADIECGGDPTAGTLSVESCGISRSDSGGDRVDLYRFTTTERQRINVDLIAQGFDPFLFLTDEFCVDRGVNADCDGAANASCLAVDLEPGTWIIGVTQQVAGGTGSYSLSVGCSELFDVCADCEVGRVECGGGSQEFELGASGCDDADGIQFDVVSFQVERTGPVTIQVGSTDFDTFITLYDSACEPIATNDDCSFVTLDSCLEEVVLDAGEYLIRVEPLVLGATGMFTVDVACADVQACVDCAAGAVTSGVPVVGTLDAADCDAGAGPFEIWGFELGDFQQVDIVATSAAFAPVLSFYSPSCEPIALESTCPDQEGSACARFGGLAPGTWFVGVSGGEGDYELSITAAERDQCLDCREGVVECGVPLEGALGPGDCQLTFDSTWYDLHQFTLDRAQRVTIDLASEEFDTYLILGCDFGIQNDNGPAGTDSQIVIDLAAGTYDVFANSVTRGLRGAYTLTVTCEPIPLCTDCQIGEISCGGDVSEALSDFDCVLGDGSFFDTWRFDLPVDSAVTIELASAEFDTILVLFGDDCGVLAVNDDCQPGNLSLSCLEGGLPAGSYFLGVNSFDAGEVGTYTLSVRTAEACEPPSGGIQLPGDANQDGGINISDGVRLLGHLFRGNPTRLPCGDGSRADNLGLLDWGGDAAIDLADAIAIFNYLFLAGPPHANGRQCLRIAECPDDVCGF